MGAPARSAGGRQTVGGLHVAGGRHVVGGLHVAGGRQVAGGLHVAGGRQVAGGLHVAGGGQMAARAVSVLAFGVLAVVAAAHVDRGGPTAFAAIGRSAYALLLGLQAAMFATQAPPKARDGRAGVWAVTLVASFGMVLAPLLPPVRSLWVPGAVDGALQAALGLVGMAMALAAMAGLRRSFSLTPQVRELATGGAYRVVRHPLYLGEGLNVLGIMAVTGSLAAVVVAVAVVAGEVVRARLEERLLRRSFPEYDRAFESVAHLLPGVW